MRVTTEANVLIRAPREAVFDLATDVDSIHEFFLGSGPVPAIERAENTDGKATHSDTPRKICNSDGTVMREQLTRFERPLGQAYRLVSGFEPPFTWLVTEGGGNWDFTEEGETTRITWKFYFELTSPLAYPVAAIVTKKFFREAMRVCLEGIKQSAESANPATVS